VATESALSRLISDMVKKEFERAVYQMLSKITPKVVQLDRNKRLYQELVQRRTFFKKVKEEMLYVFAKLRSVDSV
jgi:hypothetical protein